MDTGNDPRFLVAEKALEELQGSVLHGRIKAPLRRDRAEPALHRALAALRALRYCYAEPAAIGAMPQSQELLHAVGEVEAALGGPGFEERIKEDALAVARAGWAVGNVRSLAARLAIPGQGLETAVDLAAGRVLTAAKHPRADSLLVTRVAAGRGLTVVTNDLGVKPDDRVGLALLPPADLRGVVSQGMFLGAGKGVLKGVEAGPDGRPRVPDAALAETRSMVAQYVGKK